MNINLIMEFFYKKASKRIREKVNESGLTHRQIYMRDSKQISWIINNNKTRNNRFLITDAVLENSDDFMNPIGLLPILTFNNIREILWGTDEEINKYLLDLFRLLWLEVTEDNNPYQLDRELYLCDYVDYAKYSTYWNILTSPENIYPAIMYGIYEDDVMENIDSAREFAFKYLYHKCKQNFTEIFFSFANNTKSFHKIDKVFQNSFIEKSFVPMLNEYKPDDNSLGIRAKMLIESDLSQCASLVSGNKKDSKGYLSKLIHISSKYITELEHLQSSMTNFLFMDDSKYNKKDVPF